MLESNHTTTTAIDYNSQEVPCHNCGNVHHFAVMEKDADGNFICPDCLSADYVQCPHCNNYYKDDDTRLTSTTEGQVCPDCLDSEYVTCDDCGSPIFKENALQTASGDYICESCYEDSYFTCDHCGEIHWANDVVYIHNRRGETVYYVCDDCAQHHYYRCEDCGEYYEADAVETDHTGTCICTPCFESDYAYCDECECITHYDNISYDENTDQHICDDCAAEHRHQYDNGLLHDYNLKPESKFYSAKETSKLYFGVENELSFCDLDDRNEALDFILNGLNGGQDFHRFYCKEDGSLHNGVELVSHPHTFNAFLAQRENLEKTFKEIERLTDGDRDGLHIHISKGAMSDAHKVRFGSFFAACKDEIELIARRKECHWASYGNKPHTGKDCLEKAQRNSDRYHAVNWQNKATVEIGIFRSTVDADEYLNSIAFCHAAYQFTKSQCSIVEILHDSAKVWCKFLDYLKTDNRYASLRSFLVAEMQRHLEEIRRAGIINGARLQSYLSILSTKNTKNGKGNKASKRAKALAA